MNELAEKLSESEDTLVVEDKVPCFKPSLLTPVLGGVFFVVVFVVCLFAWVN